MIGIRNPIAPPLVIHHDAAGKSWCDFQLGAAYGGRPVTCTAESLPWFSITCWASRASDGANPRLTGTIGLRYVRATRLGSLHAEATTTRIDGVKTFAAGHLPDKHGVTVEAEGVFILPRWARERTD